MRGPASVRLLCRPVQDSAASRRRGGSKLLNPLLTLVPDGAGWQQKRRASRRTLVPHAGKSQRHSRSQRQHLQQSRKSICCSVQPRLPVRDLLRRPGRRSRLPFRDPQHDPQLDHPRPRGLLLLHVRLARFPTSLQSRSKNPPGIASREPRITSAATTQQPMSRTAPPLPPSRKTTPWPSYCSATAP